MFGCFILVKVLVCVYYGGVDGVVVYFLYQWFQGVVEGFVFYVFGGQVVVFDDVELFVCLYVVVGCGDDVLNYICLVVEFCFIGEIVVQFDDFE